MTAVPTVILFKNRASAIIAVRIIDALRALSVIAPSAPCRLMVTAKLMYYLVVLKVAAPLFPIVIIVVVVGTHIVIHVSALRE
jgi:hypothetical protein